MTSSHRFTPDTLVRLRRLGSLDAAPDGTFVVAAIEELSADDKSLEINLHRIDVAPAGDALARTTPLTRSSRKKSSPRVLADGSIAFLAQPDPDVRPVTGAAGSATGPSEDRKKDDAGAPKQLHRIPPGGGEPELLTHLPCGVQAFEVSRDLKTVVLLAQVHAGATLDDLAERDAEWKDRKSSGRLYPRYPLRYWDHWYGPRHPHLLVGDGSARDLRDLTPGLELGLEEATVDLSPDGTQACVDVRHVDADLRFEQHLVVVDVRTGEKRAVTSGGGEHWAQRWSPDGRRIACLHHRAEPRVTGKRDIKVVDVATGDARLVTSDLDVWPERPIWADERTLLFSCDERGHHVVKAFDVESGEVRSLTTEGHAAELQLSADRRTLWFTLDSIAEPADLWSVPLAGGAPRRRTRLNDDVLEGVAVSKGESHACVGCEGANVQAWEVRPPDFDPSRKYPLLLWIHGGPIHSYLDQFHYRWNPQIYASAGYVVLMVNPRGSTGFGQQFIQDNNGDWGNRCYEDLMRTADAWCAKPYVDASRVAAMGASFGGYMVNWIAGRETRFRCLVSHAGLFNLPAFHGTTDCGPEWELEFGGVPWDSPEIYEQWSPHRHVAKFRTPTLVTHGELDYRVPLSEGLMMFQALQRMRVPSKFLYFPDENHWILKPANAVLWNETLLAWLEEWMA